jgi:hypothetical protein
MTAKPNIAGEHRDRYLLLLSLISVTFVLLMLVDFAKLDTLTSDALVIAVTVLTAAMLLAALWTSAASSRLVAVAGFVGGVSVVAAVVTMFTEEAYRPSFLWVMLLAFAPLVVVRRILSHDEVTLETMLGAICAYLLIALAFSYVYLLINSPTLPVFGTDQPSTAYPYFSLVTITTLGYGDIAPATEPARVLASGEAVIGQVFLVIFVARIVSLFSGSWRRPRPSEVS